MFYGNWQNFRLLCGNHEEEVEMIIHEGPHSLYYSCPRYQSIYGKKHTGRSCNNRLNLVDYEYMVNHLSDVMHDPSGSLLPIVGYSFQRKGVSYEVVAQDGEKVTVKMLNKKAMAK